MTKAKDSHGPVCSTCNRPTVRVGTLPRSGLSPAVDVFLCEHCRTLITVPPLSADDVTPPVRAAAS